MRVCSSTLVADDTEGALDWSLAREDGVSPRLLPSRATDAARTVLGGYPGVAICDAGP